MADTSHSADGAMPASLADVPPRDAARDVLPDPPVHEPDAIEAAVPVRPDDGWETIIVGAGPAGLTAAMYMGRLLRRTLVLHDGRARAARIPLTHNVPAYPEGVTGPDLLARMTAHAVEYGVEVRQAEVTRIAHEADAGPAAFVVTTGDGRVTRSRTLILATGIWLNQIALPHAVHEDAIEKGVLRYCPVCDGYEHVGKRIGIIGADNQGAGEAMFVRGFSPHVTLIPQRFDELDDTERAELDAAGITVIDRPVARYGIEDDAFKVWVDGAPDPLVFDVVYPALGVTPRTELADKLGLDLTPRGEVGSRSPFETAVPGLFCAGDIVEGLDQISVAMGHGAIASVKAHNWMRDCDAEALRANRPRPREPGMSEDAANV